MAGNETKFLFCLCGVKNLISENRWLPYIHSIKMLDQHQEFLKYQAEPLLRVNSFFFSAFMFRRSKFEKNVL